MNPKHLVLRDRWLEDVVAGLLQHDERLRGLPDVHVRFDGGVAHVDGRVPSEHDRVQLREAVCSLRGVHAMWDGLLVGDRPALRTLDVGCGGAGQKRTSYGVDLHRAPGVDVVADVTRPLPFADRSVDRVYAVHVTRAARRRRRVTSSGLTCVGSATAAIDCQWGDSQTFTWFTGPHGGSQVWAPLHVGYDGASLFADLQPVRDQGPLPDPGRVARFFD